MSSTFQLDWVKDGEPFEVSPDRITLGDIEAAQKARRHVLEGLDDQLADTPAFLEDEVRAEIVREMDMAENQTLITRYLMRVDPSLKELTREELLEQLTAQKVGELGAALQAAATEGGNGGGLEDPSP